MKKNQNLKKYNSANQIGLQGQEQVGQKINEPHEKDNQIRKNLTDTADLAKVESLPPQQAKENKLSNIL